MIYYRDQYDKADDVFHRNLGRIISEDNVNHEFIRSVSRNWDVVKSLTKSPIEAIMAAELLFTDNGYGMVAWGPVDTASIGPFHPRLTIQESMFGYIADFCIRVHSGDLVHTLVVECDGHAFHEKTKEQAQHDKARDRAMVSNGVRVLRFTGSEIFRDSNKCAIEICELLRRLSDDLGERSGLFNRTEGESLP